MLKNRRILFVVVGIVLSIIAFLVWAPFMGDAMDVSRVLSNSMEWQTEIAALGDYSCDSGGSDVCCDGLSMRWVPFGRMIDFCGYQSWYVGFWEIM
ncbi:MAG: hypothetical protein WCT46_00255 [Candidatus Gracilibacteria bacterium]|jgi:hypothetical protein